MHLSPVSHINDFYALITSKPAQVNMFYHFTSIGDFVSCDYSFLHL